MSREVCGDEHVGHGPDDVDAACLGHHGGEDPGPVVWVLRHQGEQEDRNDAADAAEDEQGFTWNEMEDEATCGCENCATHYPGGKPERCC